MPKDYFAGKEYPVGSLNSVELRCPRAWNVEILTTMLKKKKLLNNTHSIKAVNSGERYCSNFPVAEKELIPGVAISSLK